MKRQSAVAVLFGVAALAVMPALVAAHPLGNFTINHYAGLRIAPDRVSLDIVIDQAEIPSFQERQRIDTDADGALSGVEIGAERLAACPRLATALVLTAGAAPVPLTTMAAGLSFPVGAAGVPTMRLVCEFEALTGAPIAGPTSIRFEDRSNADRIGWREIVAQGDGTFLTTDLPATSVSKRLTTYPQDLLNQALDMRGAFITARPGGPALPPFVAPDATRVLEPTAPGQSGASSVAPPAASPAAVPGGVGGEIADLLGTGDFTPLVLLLSFFTAVALGAGHALTPGHGKTIMAAYLVGTRGSARHAIGLGLATAVSHTIGVLVLALVILAAGSALPADRVYPVLAAVSGLIVVAIGTWLLATQASRWLRAPRCSAWTPTLLPATGGHESVAHGPGQGHAQSHQHGPDAGSDARHGGSIGHEHVRPEDGQLQTQVGRETVADAGMHRHGWRVHSHVPPAAVARPTLTWKSLFALGLSGGLVPSTNALLILVATVAAGRAAYGLVLVIAFGIGMAAVLVGVGIAMVYASGLLGRLPRRSSLSRLAAFAPTVAAIAVLVLGLYLTQQALVGNRVL